MLLWSALRVSRGLDVAFARIDRADAHRSFLTNVRDAAVALAATALAVGAVVAVSALLPLGGPAPDDSLRTLWLALALPVVFLPLYYVFPDCSVTVRAVIPGAALAGLGWMLLGFLFGTYIEHRARGSPRPASTTGVATRPYPSAHERVRRPRRRGWRR